MFILAGGGLVSAEQAWSEDADPISNARQVTIHVLRQGPCEPAIISAVVGARYRMGARRRLTIAIARIQFGRAVIMGAVSEARHPSD